MGIGDNQWYIMGSVVRRRIGGLWSLEPSPGDIQITIRPTPLFVVSPPCFVVMVLPKTCPCKCFSIQIIIFLPELPKQLCQSIYESMSQNYFIGDKGFDNLNRSEVQFTSLTQEFFHDALLLHSWEVYTKTLLFSQWVLNGNRWRVCS